MSEVVAKWREFFLCNSCAALFAHFAHHLLHASIGRVENQYCLTLLEGYALYDGIQGGGGVWHQHQISRIRAHVSGKQFCDLDEVGKQLPVGLTSYIKIV